MRLPETVQNKPPHKKNGMRLPETAAARLPT